jgi:isocitrate/isopropylmalate dehydrogenase
MMLDYLGFPDAAVRLERAIEATYAAGRQLTPDQGGTASSDQFAAAVRSRL